jgi:hypothetical protein
MTISVATIDITILGNPIALTAWLRLKSFSVTWNQGSSTEKYGRTLLETYRDDFVISGYFIWSLTYQGI